MCKRKRQIIKLNMDKALDRYLFYILFITPFCLGGFHLLISCAFSVVLLVILWMVVCRQRGLHLYRNDAILAVIALLIGFGASVLWAVDRGMAVFGIFQFFPILPFALLMMQQSSGRKDQVLESVPLSGVFMTVVSFVLRFVPALQRFFSVKGRLAGFFQYPNTFAVFLLAGLIVCVWSKRPLRVCIPCSCILLFGILLSGSRTVFILLVAVLIAVCVLRRDKQGFILAGSLVVLSAVVVLIYVVGIGDVRSVGRFLTTSLSESTLLGRILYYRDALPVILRHPFGWGYLGYYYTHHTFQTGVYSLMFVHNEPLQMLLDVGWIPSLLFFAAIAENIFSKTNTPCQRMILTVLSLHSLLDFDLQFVAVFFLFLFCMDFQKGREKMVRLRNNVALSAVLPITALCIFFGVAQGLHLFGLNRAAVRIFPAYTNAQIEMMSDCADIGQANELADQIISRNTFVAQAHRVRAGYAYALGDLQQFTEAGFTALSLDPYNTDSYADYGMKLMVAAQQSKAVGDPEVKRYCDQALRDMQALMDQTRQKTSALAWRIQDKPDFSLPKELTEYMQSIEGGQKNDG